MESLYAYIPTDRRIALARGVELPDRATGAALFADISGFTPLTEALLRARGPQRGAEELPRWLNKIYDALIDEIDRYRGSVVVMGTPAEELYGGKAIMAKQEAFSGLDAAMMVHPGVRDIATTQALACQGLDVVPRMREVQSLDFGTVSDCACIVFSSQ